ncbi:MAG TPA: glycosyltransferase [Planctomycetaceae bacterium]|nr:glycosyltransferase [Planctomycetaceae bacterium]
MLTVVVATYNNRAILERCLAQWEQHASGQPVEILVIADGCQDDTEAFLAQRQQTPWGQRHLRWLAENNVHELRCTNRGLAEARGSLVMSWHDDMYLQHPGLVPELIATFAAYQDIGLVSLSRGLNCRPASRPTTWESLTDWSRIESTIGRPVWNWLYLTEVDAVMRPWVVRRSCIERVGPLDNAFKLTEWDEADLCFRIREAGWKIATHGYERLGYYHHLGSSTLGRTIKEPYKAQAVANGQLFHDRWQATIERDCARPRKRWLRVATAGRWIRTARRALSYSVKSFG